MLTAVLDRLTSLTSKAFILGASVPVLAFAFLNSVVLYLEFGWFRAWAEPQISVAAGRPPATGATPELPGAARTIPGGA